ncbi:hypothetical protein F2P81_008338 [Scophthalmus maximus]|uniref:Tc1-like transposase DDE domain-containing protein n=1 Tax=Scophthalmus maximus TaxID=52904 RepID=A0A6A4T211_SCOMX|nr:hypothetical protein F2P81_008338 [Scophthalmus maximus]
MSPFRSSEAQIAAQIGPGRCAAQVNRRFVLWLQMSKIIFMHDNAPSHAAKNTWSILKQKIYEVGRQFTSKQQLWEAILTSCKDIQAETLQELTGSMDARIVKLLFCLIASAAPRGLLVFAAAGQTLLCAREEITKRDDGGNYKRKSKEVRRNTTDDAVRNKFIDLLLFGGNRKTNNLTTTIWLVMCLITCRFRKMTERRNMKYHHQLVYGLKNSKSSQERWKAIHLINDEIMNRRLCTRRLFDGDKSTLSFIQIRTIQTTTLELKAMSRDLIGPELVSKAELRVNTVVVLVVGVSLDLCAASQLRQFDSSV